MKGPGPDTLFRIGGLVGCGIVALPMIVQALTRDVGARITDLARGNAVGARALLVAMPVVIAALFVAAFWLNTRPASSTRTRPGSVGLLVLQALIALTVTDYFFIVAAQAPFVFAPVGALMWLAGQVTVFGGLVLMAARSGAPVAIPEMAGTPHAIAFLVTFVYLAGWQVFSFGMGYLAAGERRTRREAERRTRDLLATQQMLADSSRVAERAQISRELHDTLGHSLAVLSVNLELASHLTDGRAADVVVKAQTIARMLLSDVREVVHSLGQEQVVDLRRALTTLVAGTQSPEIHLSMPEDLGVQEPSKAHAVFRCVQEAVTNAVRHARAGHLWIQLTPSENGLDVRVSDDGQGGTTVVPGGGLNGMRERIEAVGGWLRVHAEPGRGFTVSAWIPTTRERP